MRGMPFVQVPTTLLAMIDASVGGKTGVDTPAGKNLVGAFHQPAAVIADTAVLATLPVEHLRAGLAEAIKHGVIADAELLRRRRARSPADCDRSPASRRRMLDLVARSVEIKADVVRRDERERAFARCSTSATRSATPSSICSGYALLHGEAVAIGMVLRERDSPSASASPKRAPRRECVEAVRARGCRTRVRRRWASTTIVATRRTATRRRVPDARVRAAARVGAMAAERGWSIPVDGREVLACARARALPPSMARWQRHARLMPCFVDRRPQRAAREPCHRSQRI